MTVHSSSDTNRSTRSRSSRRAVLGLTLGATLGGLGLPVILAAARPTGRRQAGPAGRPGARRRPPRRPRYRIVTRTFTSTGPIALPFLATNPYPSTIPVGGLRAGKILDINVRLSGLSARYPSHLEAVLVAPNGLRSVVLMSEAGGAHDLTNVTLGFDDQAAGWLPYAQQIVSGTYKPTLPGGLPGPDTATLRSFSGLNPNGTWRLYVADAESGGSGSIAGWALTIRARVRV